MNHLKIHTNYCNVLANLAAAQASEIVEAAITYKDGDIINFYDAATGNIIYSVFQGGYSDDLVMELVEAYEFAQEPPLVLDFNALEPEPEQETPIVLDLNDFEPEPEQETPIVLDLNDFDDKI
jgi:hypothetical protein